MIICERREGVDFGGRLGLISKFVVPYRGCYYSEGVTKVHSEEVLACMIKDASSYGGGNFVMFLP